MSELLPRQHKREGSDVPNTPEMPLDTPPIPEYLPGQPRTTVERAIAAAAVTSEIDKPTLGDRLKNGFGHRGRMIGATGLAAAILVGGGVALAHSGEKTEPRKLPTASAPAVPGETAPSSAPSTEVTPDAKYMSPGEVEPKSVTDNELFNKLPAAAQAEIRRDDAMDLDDFQKLDPEEQQRFGQFFYDVYEKFGETQIKKGLSRLNEYLPTVKPDVMNDGQQVLAQIVKVNAVAKWSMTVKGDPTVIDESKKLAAEKALSLSYLTTNEPTAYGNPYPDMVDSFKATDSLIPTPGVPARTDGYELGTVFNPGEPVANYYVPEGNDGTDPRDFSNPAKYMHVMQNNQMTQRIAMFKKFTDIQGKERAAWLLAQTVSEDDQFAPMPAYRAPTN